MHTQSSKWGRWSLLATMLATAAFLLQGCNGGGGGGDGSTGSAGPAGPAGPTGAAGPDATATVKVANLAPEAWADLAPTATVTKVTISSPPVVEFKVMDANGNPVLGLADNTSMSSTATVRGYTNIAFALAKLVPGTNGSPSKWVNYAVFAAPTVAQKAGTVAASASCDSTTAPTWCATRPTTDNQGTLVDNGDGSYKYTFLRDITKAKDIVASLKDAADGSYKNVDAGDLTYDPTLTHRLVIQISGNARGTGSNTADAVTLVPGVVMKNPANIVYDFVPATGKAVTATDTQRNIVDTANCNECHGKLQALGFHGGSRGDARFCVVCHTDQRKYGQKEAATTATGYSGSTNRINGLAVGDFPAFIHRLHMGDELTKTGYNYANVRFNDVVYPIYIGGGGVRLCSKCHTQTATAPQGDNWNAVPSRMACGACHDGIDFATGTGTTVAGVTTGHQGGAKADDKLCTTCHTADAIKTYHLAENATTHNPTVPAGLKNFTYEIASATVNSTTNAVSVKFRIKADGTAVTLKAPAAAMSAPLDGFTGGPSFLLAYTMTQDGVTTPVDYNNLGRTNAQPISVSLANLLDSNRTTTTGTLSARDADGYYTASIVGSSVVFPAGAKMRTVALQGYFTQVSPAAARHTISVVKTITGDTTRRVVVDPAKCGNCHEWFEGHGGNRVYETQVCVTCHNPGINSTGRGISDAALAAYPFSADDNAKLALWGFDKTLPNAALNFPVTTNNFKDMIHGIHAGADRTTPFVDARDRTPSAITLLDMSKAHFPNILSNCEACHKPGSYSSAPENTLASTYEYNNGTTPMTPAAYKLSFVQPNATDKVTTPFAAACVSCHDSAIAQAHIGLNGGQIKVARSALNFSGETCALCHANGKQFDPVVVHSNLK
ncbi:MAG: OmcA/MtrC family decaheme c-type cytochrome [Sterolibacterium sp.]